MGQGFVERIDPQSGSRAGHQARTGRPLSPDARRVYDLVRRGGIRPVSFRRRG